LRDLIGSRASDEADDDDGHLVSLLSTAYQLVTAAMSTEETAPRTSADSQPAAEPPRSSTDAAPAASPPATTTTTADDHTAPRGSTDAPGSARQSTDAAPQPQSQAPAAAAAVATTPAAPASSQAPAPQASEFAHAALKKCVRSSYSSLLSTETGD